ncbi:MAG: ImmA/IrrE family metallo-endopeptidase, partial [Ancrocorticia sp.]|nr:ImmA/IrrE family metallo-endopeptidase [Ancrocorticia sp.]
MDEARAFLVAAFEELGGLVVLNSMVANNTHRMLDRDEFRGFTLQSRFAPLVFVNANDTKNGQIFSLLHEFAHVWRGESGVSQGGDPLRDRATEHERWCDAVAAEVAVPAIDLETVFDPVADLTAELDRLSSRYWCSTLVTLLRLKETGLVPSAGFA